MRFGFGFNGFGFGGDASDSLGNWTPWALGPSLLGYYDAETASSFALSGSSVTTWTDLVGGYAATQATAGLKPTYSASSFNSRPGVTFDGVDDYLEYAGQPFPDAANPSEIWALVSQDALVAINTGTLAAFSYGASGGSRAIARTVVTLANRARSSSTGTGTPTAVDGSVDFSGIHLVRAVFTATTISVSVDGGAATTSSLVSATQTSLVRIGCPAFNTTAVWTGVINAILVTGPLTASQATFLTAFLKARGGIA